MSLLTLKQIGKIYVSEGSVAVGIRGVDLSFDKGEFVAITGQSGSGKSTLLNVISGMDSYEEGELLVEGEPTSHYLQGDWEEYRKRYISFIFQNYNIIESFTVLENVELALMHIENKRQRRERALELIRRVGLETHISHKGSALSGGQKQRTVIARALAKDSPIILADEPTGNLDSKTSREIVELLHEVSRDKLVIVVTHSFDELAEFATRHVRIFDGAVESDSAVIRTKDGEAANKVENSGGDHFTLAAASDTPATEPCESSGKGQKSTDTSVTGAPRAKKYGIWRAFSDGVGLGKSIFVAKPKLTVFLCALLLIGALGVMALSSVCSSAADAFETHYMFTYIPGRVVVARPTGESIDKELAATLKDATGADSMLRFDRLLDQASYSYAELRTGEGYYDYEHLYLECGWGESADNIVGRYPEKPNEVLLMLPISYKTVVGSSEILTEELSYLGLDLKVVGASYYADNNITPKCIFTEQGFEYATYSNYIIQRASTSATITVHGNGNKVFGAYEIVPVFDFGGKIYLENSDFISYLDSTPETDDVDINLSCIYYTYNYTSGDGSTTIRFEKDFDESYLSPYAPKEMRGDRYNNVLYIDASILAEMGCAVLDASYRQVSLFFENDAEAYKAAAKLEEMGYIAVPSDTTYQPDAFTVIANLILSVMMGLVFIFGIVFLAFFINLCSSRAIGAIRPDIAIMRSMGIPVSTIRVGMFTRMFLSLIPAFISIAVFGILICTVPAINNIFTYLYLWQYALIAVGIIALCARVTYKQMKNLFGESVKNALRGGDAA